MKMRDYFYVERMSWARGNASAGLLLDEGNNRCCLGFFCAQMGVPDEYLRNMLLPDDAADAGDYDIPYLTKVGVGYWGKPLTLHTELADQAAAINDDTGIDDAERERRLTELFAKHGIEVEFV